MDTSTPSAFLTAATTLYSDGSQLYAGDETNGAREVTLNSASQTLTNKTIDADSNTISNIANDEIGANAGIEWSKLEAGTTKNRILQTNSSTGLIEEIADTPVSGEFLKYNGSTYEWAEASGGSGQGGINYIDNGDAEENNTIGWATYDDGAVSTPVDGTGGSPSNITFTVQSSAPLRGVYSFQLFKDAADSQGEGVSYDFTIDSQDTNSTVYISFDYNVSNVSGTYANGDIGIFIYDVTNSALVNCRNSFSDKRFIGSFSTTDSTSYRLIFHITTTSTAAYNFYIDTVIVGPDKLLDVPTSMHTARARITSSTTVTSISAGVRSILDFDTVDFDTASGITTGTAWKYTAPRRAYYRISSKIVFNGATTWTEDVSAEIFIYKNGSLYCELSRTTGNANAVTVYATAGNGTTTIKLDKDDYIDIRLTFSSGTAKSLFIADSNYSFVDIEEVKILENSGLAISSQENINTAVKAKYTATSSAAMPDTATIFNFSTKVYDTHNAVTIGASWKFTSVKSGYYKVSATIPFASSASASRIDVAIRKNGSVSITGYETYATSSVGTSRISSTLYLDVGDYIDVVHNETVNGGTYTSVQEIVIEEIVDLTVFAATPAIDEREANSNGFSLATSSVWLQYVGNSITLPAGTWELKGVATCRGTVDVNYIRAQYSLANGANTGSQPANLTGLGVSAFAGEAIQSFNVASGSVVTVILPSPILTITSSQTIYLTTYVAIDSNTSGYMYVNLRARRLA